MHNRREFLRLAALGALWPGALAWGQKKPEGILVNDLHGQLSATWVNRIVQPDTLDGVRGALRLAQSENRALCIAGGRQCRPAALTRRAGPHRRHDSPPAQEERAGGEIRVPERPG